MSATQFLAIAALIASHLQFAESQCPADWHYYAPNCYKLFVGPLDSEAVHAACKGPMLLAEAVSIHSEAENDFVRGLLGANEKAHTGGISFDIGDGAFAWSDHSAPNYTASVPDKHSFGQAFMVQQSVAKWEAVDRTTTHQYICKKKGDEVGSPGMPDASGCETGWQSLTSFCYKLYDGPKNGAEAESACRDSTVNADLVSIHNDAENEFVKGLIEGNATKALTGGIVFDNKILWSDGTEYDYQKIDAATAVSLNAIAAVKGQDTWEDVDPNEKLPYICKKKGDPGAETTQAPPTSDDCDDVSSSCSRLMTNCGRSGSIYDVMYDNCRKTCNYCNCKDEANCSLVADRCWTSRKVIVNMNKICKRTCQMCACHDLLDCSPMLSFCENKTIEAKLRESCAATCGFCVRPK